MAKWVHKLQIKSEWQACKDGQITLKDLALVAIKKLDAFGIKDDQELDDIIEEFTDFAEEKKKMQTDKEFDEIWERLYDWADQPLDDNWPPKKMCCIETF